MATTKKSTTIQTTAKITAAPIVVIPTRPITVTETTTHKTIPPPTTAEPTHKTQPPATTAEPTHKPLGINKSYLSRITMGMKCLFGLGKS